MDISNVFDTISLLLLLAFAWDTYVGEPASAWHPVVWMGHYLRAGMRQRRRMRSCSLALAAGFATWASGVMLFASGVWLLAWALALGGWWWPLLLILSFLLSTTFSLRALLRAAEEVKTALAAGELPEARRLLAWHLVSRDTTELSEAEVAGACVASLAENFTDSLVAPLSYAALGGLPAAFAYRLINTADAMMGYRSPAWECFGKSAARCDDVLNYLPARAAAALLCMVAAYAHKPAKLWPTGLALWRRAGLESGRTPSPNGGQTMAVMAQALQCRLEKRGVYSLGDGYAEATIANISQAQALLWRSSVLTLLLLVLGRGLWGLLR